MLNKTTNNIISDFVIVCAFILCGEIDKQAINRIVKESYLELCITGYRYNLEKFIKFEFVS